MAQQEVLELVATAIDRATPALEQVRGEIERLRGSNIGLDADTRRALTNSTRHINALVGTQPVLRGAAQNMATVSAAARTMTTSIGGATTVIQREFVPLITRATSAIVGATLSIFAFNRALERTKEVTNLSELTGLNRDAIKGFQELGKNLGVSGEAINRQLENFGKQAQQIKRLGMGQFGESLAKLPWGDPQRLKADLEEARTLRNKGLISEEQFLDRVVAARAAHIKRMQSQIGPQETATVLQELFGDDPEVLHKLIMSMPLPELEKRLKALAAATRELDPEQVKKFTASMAGFNRELGNLTVDVLGPLLPKLNEFLAATTRLMAAKPGEYWLIDKMRETKTALTPVFADIVSGFDTVVADISKAIAGARFEFDTSVIENWARTEWPRIKDEIKTVYELLKADLEGKPIDWGKVLNIKLMQEFEARFERSAAYLSKVWTNIWGSEEAKAAAEKRFKEADEALSKITGTAAETMEPAEKALERMQRQQRQPSLQLPAVPNVLNEQLLPKIPPLAVPPRGAQPLRFTGEQLAPIPFNIPEQGRSAISDLSGGFSENIEDRRTQEANTREVVKLTDEMRKLNENFMRGAGGSFPAGTGGAVGFADPSGGVTTRPTGTGMGGGGGARVAPVPSPRVPALPDVPEPDIPATLIDRTRLPELRRMFQTEPDAGKPPATLIDPKQLPNLRQMFEQKQTGGPVNPNRPVLVGERGPELFTPWRKGNINPGAGGGDLNRGQYEAMFKGTGLAERYDQIVELSGRHGVPASLSAAIMAQESGRGKSLGNNNPFSLSGAGRAKKYQTLDQGIALGVANTARLYKMHGGGTDKFDFAALAETYAPTKNATNDPRGLNKFWLPSVSKFQQELRSTAQQSQYPNIALPGQSPALQQLAGKFPSIALPNQRVAPNMTIPNTNEGRAAALNFALDHLNENEVADRTKLSRFFADKGINIDPKSTAWCAAYVNSTLKQAGIKGTGSLAAGSFLKDPRFKPLNFEQAQPGDIAVLRGRSPRTGMEGPHVGYVYERRVNPETGVNEVRLLGGNQSRGSIDMGGAVTISEWRPASSVHLRQTPAPTMPAEQRVTPVDPGRIGELRQRFSTADPVGIEPGSLSVKNAEAQKVEGVGRLDVNVKAPRGTSVRAEGEGMFTKINMNRRVAEEPAAQQGSGEE